MVPENIYRPHRRSLEILQGKRRRWASEPEFSALTGARVELACPDREKDITYLLMIEKQRERNKSFLDPLRL